MKITVLQKTQHENHPIYIMQFSNIFQYLFVHENAIFQDHITMPSSFINWLKYKLGFIETPYTAEEIETGQSVLLSGAVDSIDALIKK